LPLSGLLRNLVPGRSFKAQDLCPYLPGTKLDDRRAKILSVNLNGMKAQSVSVFLSELIHYLSQVLILEDPESIQSSNSTTLDTVSGSTN
jgi:acyl-[acyl carrier protein]--UDP-N-acetylglucosamine O-acyltransferase